MKRFIAVASFLIVSAVFTTLVATPEHQTAVKIEVSDAFSASDMLAVQILDMKYVAEVTTEVNKDFIPKTIEALRCVKSASIFRPPKKSLIKHDVAFVWRC